MLLRARQLQQHSPAVIQLLLRPCVVVPAAACHQLHTGNISGSSSSSSSSSYRRWWTSAVGAAAAAATAAATGSAVALADALPGSSTPAAAAPAALQSDGVKGEGKLLSLPFRQRVFFNYEKRIRDLSSLEKIYDYFATHEGPDGAKVMSSADVVRALVPTYPPVGSDVERAGFLEGERAHSADAHAARSQLLRFFDHDGDGTLSFDEFVLIVIILSVPEKDVDIVFDVMDLDDNGVIDAAEFGQVLEQLERRAGLGQPYHARVGKHAAAIGDAKEVTQRLFEVRQGAGVSLSRFREFMTRLQEGMLQLEFAHYDASRRGFISGADFGNSLVTAANIKIVDTYLDKVGELPPHLAAAKISFADFKAMAQLRRNMHMLSFALDFCTQVQRRLPRDEFAKLISKTLGVTLSPVVLDILFHVFAAPDGTLDGPSFVDTMKRRNKVPGYKKGHGLTAAEEESSLRGFFNCIGGCISGGGDALRLPQQ